MNDEIHDRDSPWFGKRLVCERDRMPIPFSPTAPTAADCCSIAMMNDQKVSNTTSQVNRW